VSIEHSSNEQNQQQEKPQGKGKRLGLGAVIAIVAVVKLLAWPLIQIGFLELRHRAGHGWDRARPDIVEHYETGLKKVGRYVPARYASDVANCQADAYVAWLNKSGCRSYRIDVLTSASAHQEELSGCLKNSGEDLMAEKIQVDCVKKIVPNRWHAFETAYAEEFFAVWQKRKSEGDPSRENHAPADCVAHSYVENIARLSAAEGANCAPMNESGKDLVALLTNNPCALDMRARLDDHMDSYWASCEKQIQQRAH